MDSSADLSQFFSQIDSWTPDASASASPSNQGLLLEQQFKVAQLQQLQQLQNQIFQQQIAIISGQNSVGGGTSGQMDGSAASAYLPTPGPSAELRPQQQHNVEFVSPMILDYAQAQAQAHAQQQQQQVHAIPNFQQQNPAYHRGSFSAPAHVAFSQSGMQDIDIDVSPLTSPWLGAEYPGHNTGRPSKRQSPPTDHDTESSSSAYLSRKKHSSVNFATGTSATAMSPGILKKSGSRGTRSTGSSTPLMHSSVHSAAMMPVGDSPSPVDLNSTIGDMPPPPNPSTSSPMDVSAPPESSMMIKPVTPASIMNLGGFGGGSSSFDIYDDASATPKTGPTTAGTSRAKRRKSVGSSPSVSPVVETSGSNGPGPIRRTSTRARNNGTKTSIDPEKSKAGSTSPAFKPILPASPSILPSSSNGALNVTASSSSSNSGAAPPKTSHKAAEQKRRDSLKTTFDDLRGLLPPIPLNTDGEAGESPSLGPSGVSSFLKGARPSLPGSLPPRGPPKSLSGGPNKGVSKLQLLICGNEYIRLLKGRVERRDCEIAKLRREVAGLRGQMAGMNLDGGWESCDLEKDLDAPELLDGFIPPGPQASAEIQKAMHRMGTVEEGDED